MSELEQQIEETQVTEQASEAASEAYSEVSNITMAPMNMMSFEEL